MATDYTQQQSQDDERRAQELSLKRTSPPAEVPGYETQRFLGSGAYGEVWVAVDQNTGRRVAIKFYTHRGGVDWSLLSREVEKLAVLSADRYVVQLLDVGWDADPPYYVMDYIENGSLEELLQREGPRTVYEAVELFREVAVGLVHLHGKGVLHCDLKPANVLLDEDQNPRLADFGQSRLSHEQSPALGTLFYMAPEQADMDAVPDARWDVYALGALLYCMLTGEPPHRTGDVIDKIDSATDLSDRLARYRSAITSAPKLTEHRKVPGVDRALAEIIERCLAPDPKERFANVQGVLDALKSRDEARARRPLMILGFVGPTLLLLVMAVFAWRMYQRAVYETDVGLTHKAVESNTWAAQFAARTPATQINRYYRDVEKVAEDPRFQHLLFDVLDDTDLTHLRQQLADPSLNGQLSEVRAMFIQHPERQELQNYMNDQMDSTNLPNAASWFVCDANGTQVASAFAPEKYSETIGKNYSYRTYFHGGNQDFDGEATVRDQHIKSTHLSAPFVSTATGTWKVAFSTPIYEGDEFKGVVAVTVEMGKFVDFEHRDVQYVILVDGRDGPMRGAILEHPLFERFAARQEPLPREFSEYRVKLDEITEENPFFSDPLGAHPAGKDYDKRWIAAKAAVKRQPRNQSDYSEDTGLLVLAVENHEEVVQPAYQLGNSLMQLGFWALVVIIAVALAMWYLVVRTFRETHHRAARPMATLQTATSFHSMRTLSAPKSDRQ